MSPLYEDPCPYCGRNFDLVYLCEDCHEVFCADCVNSRTDQTYWCMNCGGTEINSDKQGRLFCKGCHGTEIQTMNKPTPICPNCQGVNVVKINDKQTQLVDQFKSVVDDTRSFLTPLENLMNQLNDRRQQLFRLREESPRCYHYSTLESEFLIVFKLFDAAKNNIYEQVSGFFGELQRHLNYISEIPRTYPSNLPFITSIIKNLDREEKKVAQSVTEAISSIESKIETINSKLNTVEEIQVLFNAFTGKFILENDEKIVYGLKCKLSEGSGSNGDVSNRNGTILLTSKRLNFFHEQGVFKKKTVLLFSVKLDDLQQIGVKGRLKKTVSLDFVNSMYNFALTKEKREELIEWIDNAREFDNRNMLDSVNFEKLQKYKLNIKLFREEIENAIFDLIGYHGSMLSQNPRQIPTAANQVINSNMYRASRNNNSTVPNQISRQDGYHYNSVRSEEFAAPPSKTGFRSFEYPRTGSENFQNGLRQGDKPSSPYMTPAGHFGYPHDRPLSPHHFSSISGSPAYSDPIPPNYSSPFLSSEYGPQDNSAQPIGSRTPNFGVASEYESNGHTYMSKTAVPNFNGFRNINSEPVEGNNMIDQLRQEEYALSQTLHMLEKRFDDGTMNNVEFVKGYKSLQKDLFVIQERQKQLRSQFNA
jgi:hypothetical protein